MQGRDTEYKAYRAMDTKLKLKRIKEAVQMEQHRKTNPQGVYKFLEEDFIPFEVYQGKNKLPLKTYRHYKAKDMSDAVGIVVMFHGLNSHIGHGAHIAEVFGMAGLVTVGFDHRGFGQSPGEKGYVESLEGHLFDSLTFVKRVKSIYPNIPTFGMGLSMGGMTVYHLSLRYKDLFKGVIMMAPAIKNIVDGYLVSLVKGISSIFHKKFKIPIKQPRGQATRNPAITEDVFKDPYAYTDKPSMKTMKMLISTMDVTPSTFSSYESSFVIIQGGLDKLVHPDGAFELFDKCKSTDKTIWFYEDMWHDIWHEEEIEEITKKTTEWLLKRVPRDEVIEDEVKVINTEKNMSGEMTFEEEELESRHEIQKVRRQIRKEVGEREGQQIQAQELQPKET